MKINEIEIGKHSPGLFFLIYTYVVRICERFFCSFELSDDISALVRIRLSYDQLAAFDQPISVVTFQFLLVMSFIRLLENFTVTCLLSGRGARKDYKQTGKSRLLST